MGPLGSAVVDLDVYVGSSPSYDSKECVVVEGIIPDVGFDNSFELSRIEEYGDITGDVGEEIHGVLSSLFD